MFTLYVCILKKHACPKDPWSTYCMESTVLKSGMLIKHDV